MSILLHPGQSTVFRAMFIERLYRFIVVCCSRGWGKSYMAAVAACTALYELFELDESVPNKVVYIIAPTYDQVTEIYYPLLAYDLGLESIALKSSRDLGRFVFPGRVELRLVSYEAVERLRGKGAYFVVWDEVTSCKKGISAKKAWQGVIQPCIITRWSEQNAKRFDAKNPGRGLIISTPKGYDFFHELYSLRELNPLWGSYHYDYTQSPYLDINEIESIKNDLDPIEFASEYLASFKESGNSVFYMFDRDRHVTSQIPDFVTSKKSNDLGEDVHACIDFNVGLQCTSLFALRGGQAQFIDEIKGHPDTESLAKDLRNRFKNHRIFAYPDPSGKARKTSAPVGVTDFSILKSQGIQVNARKKAPPIVDSVAAVNRMLVNANNNTNLYIHPRCKGLILSLERTKWVDGNPNTATIDKSENLEHFSDGIRYGLEYLFPIQSHTTPVKRGFNF